MSGFTIPNAPGLTNPELADVDSGDFNIIAAGIAGDGVVSGCLVAPTVGPSMAVTVAAGTIRLAATDAAVLSGTHTITAADPNLPRKDLVVSDGTGTVTVLVGTPLADSMYPTIPSGRVVLAEVFVPRAAVAVTAACLVDKRVILPGYVRSVNGQTGAVTLDADGVGAASKAFVVAMAAALG